MSSTEENNQQFSTLEDQEEKLRRMRHSAAHILAEAVLETFPEAKYAIGPPIDNGFYYDFELPRSLTPEDLISLEKRMRKTVKKNVAITGELIPKEKARRIFADQPYKLELIDDLDEELVGHFQHAEFQDLCRGGHTDRTGEIGSFKLSHVAGAYWRGDEKNTMLQRIYGLLFFTDSELQDYIEAREEAERRDHRRIGRELDLFSTHEEYGPGLVYWHPKGGRVRVEIEDVWKLKHYENGYEIVFTPHTGKASLWEQSGHLDFYSEGMFSPMDIDGSNYYMKPMNCPFHIQIFRNTRRSYRELPMRLAELGTVYRYERSGVLHGLMRVRGFTQDDAHIICTATQMENEIVAVVDFVLELLRLFGFTEFEANLSTQPAKSVGEKTQWDEAEKALERSLKRANLPYEIDEGGGAFYGPKIDIHLKDTLGRKWQCSTVQFDFNLPERFNMTYIGEDGNEHRPYMIHRALLGSIERFFGILLEHYGGALPLWLSPIQAVIIPIADRHNEFAFTLKNNLATNGLRIDVDDSNERMGNKIRKAQLQKIPYMLIAGDREIEANQVAIRRRNGEDLGTMNLEDVNELLSREKINRT
ncbi:MAG: threonine--tRNA ligase [Chloroflexi bacterium]|nr:threonine--tRNA ligase [Chloroflexota bacterium]|tara:strand:+ start:6575 stop:8338 length:1764 start_codon:yes stop_codon:yes gene_type:complete